MMQLMVAIVQDEDADLLCERLVARGYRLTRVATVGPFLARGNATVMIGVEDDRARDVLAIIGATCRTRTGYINPTAWSGDPATVAMAGPAVALEVTIGGASVFILPVKRFARLHGGPTQPDLDKRYPSVKEGEKMSDLPPGPKGEQDQMNLLVAIVHSSDAEAVTRALLAAGHRLTRINSAGGFLRRGNATLLIGAEEEKVDEVLKLIQANCQERTEPNSPSAGIPMYGATVFVLEAARLVRV